MREAGSPALHPAGVGAGGTARGGPGAGVRAGGGGRGAQARWGCGRGRVNSGDTCGGAGAAAAPVPPHCRGCGGSRTGQLPALGAVRGVPACAPTVSVRRAAAPQPQRRRATVSPPGPVCAAGVASPPRRPPPSLVPGEAGAETREGGREVGGSVPDPRRQSSPAPQAVPRRWGWSPVGCGGRRRRPPPGWGRPYRRSEGRLPTPERPAGAFPRPGWQRPPPR